jgi:SAM-dependent methyltransferase
VLDVGCAAGYFLRVMREQGWDVRGVEPSAPMRQRAQHELGSALLHASLDDPGLAPDSFDLVTLWDVLEHVPDPLATLRRARELLRPGGRLVLETQNVASPAARLLGRRWQHYKHAEHLYHFDPRTLRRALGQAGFELLESRPWLGGKYVSGAFVVERARRVGAWLSLLLRPLALLGSRGVYVNLLDEMVAVAAPQSEPR